MVQEESRIGNVLEKAESLEWGLFVFFSVDIEGATAYKVDARSRWQNGDEDWCAVFEKFYRDFPEIFLREYLPFTQSRATSAIADPIKPLLWKFVGDEILFYAPLSDSRQVLEHLRSFGQAIVLYNSRLKGEHKNIQCKGTAWLGGVPVNNRIVTIPALDIDNKAGIDFVGSSIDCGFRLSKFSSSRRLVVSLDLLWMFAESFSENTSDRRYDGMLFRYHGRHDLKGVFSGKPYPVFWYDLYLTGECIEDELGYFPKSCDLSSVIRLCRSIAGSMNENDFIRPFIAGDPSKLFDTILDSFERKRQDLLNYKENVAKSLKIDTKQEPSKQDGLLSDAVLLPPK